jgi:general secretion pathway protein K
MLKALKSRKGSALMLAIFTTTLVIFLTNEIAEQTIMEYLSSATEVRRVQAKYAARACLNLNLLRIKGYQQATRSLGQSLPDMTMLDMIWSFPLSWPPSLPSEMSGIDRSTMKRTVGGSLLKEQFVSSIESESGKIDINDLGSPSQALQMRTRMQLLQRLQARVINQRDSFSERYANFNFELLFNHIADWVDADQQSRNGGAEASYYTQFQNAFLPPNRPFKSLQELHMVEGMTDEIFEVLKPMITLYGAKGINVNYADREVLMALFSNYPPQVAEQVIPEIIKRRSDINLGGPFRDQNDFFGFISAFTDPSGLQDGENRVPLYFGAEMNFRINCTGVSGKMTTEIETVVFDAEVVAGRLQSNLTSERMLNEKPECQGEQGEALYECLCRDQSGKNKENCINSKKQGMGGGGQGQGQSPAPLPPGPPRIIFQRVQ